MSEIITIITSKPNWQTKINNYTIGKQWKQELQEQGISETVFDIAMELLRRSISLNEYNQRYGIANV
eukprot:gene14359-15886_t